jgi:cytochrome c
MMARRGLAVLLVGIAMLAPWHSVVAAEPKGDAEAGLRPFGYCAQCHSLRPGVNMTGPSLAGVFGRKAAGLKGFDRYSSALAHSGVVWNAETLDAWLAEPTRFIPDTYMRIAGINDAQVRANLIALLRLAGPDGPTGAAAKAPEVTRPDLKSEPPARQVRAILSCGETYRITTVDGRTRPFWENNLRFKTDHGPNGPRPGWPVLTPMGMLGDRAAVVFARPEEIARAIKHDCPAKEGSGK